MRGGPGGGGGGEGRGNQRVHFSGRNVLDAHTTLLGVGLEGGWRALWVEGLPRTEWRGTSQRPLTSTGYE